MRLAGVYLLKTAALVKKANPGGMLRRIVPATASLLHSPAQTRFHDSSWKLVNWPKKEGVKTNSCRKSRLNYEMSDTEAE